MTNQSNPRIYKVEGPTKIGQVHASSYEEALELAVILLECDGSEVSFLD